MSTRNPYRLKAALRQRQLQFDGGDGQGTGCHLSLFELNSLVRDAIELTMPDSYWVEAELADARESGGHCYMELVQKTRQAQASWQGRRPSVGAARGHSCVRTSNG